MRSSAAKCFVNDCVRKLQDDLQPRDKLMNRQSKSILIVDDDISVADSLRLFLTDAGHRVLTAHNLAKARSVFGANRFDLVITDLCLPDGTGIDVLTQVKTEAPETEVILMTGHGSLGSSYRGDQTRSLLLSGEAVYS